MTQDQSQCLLLKKIAFVAMPFGNKSTGLPLGRHPSKVDFDALWSKAIKPALENLNYLPIRADEQSGSVIVKDMLEQLVHADLVLADISLSNGNVYYEAGVRHAAKKSGCVLIMASWAKALFDLQQITQLRYEFGSDNPGIADYQRVRDTLERGIPILADSVGPVFELANPTSPGESSSHALREQAESLFNFNQQLNEAVHLADTGIRGDRTMLRLLIGDENKSHIAALPTYAIKDMITAVRDNLNWGELLEFLNSLPEPVRKLGWVREQEALAEAKLDNLPKSISLLQEIVECYGPSPYLYGNIGSRYRDVSRKERDDRVSLNKAIAAYETGRQLDLNDYYCAHKLLVSYVQRGRDADKERARECALHVAIACQRAEKINPDDEWLAPAKLILAIYNREKETAETLLYQVLDRGWTNWKLVGLLADLKTLFDIELDKTVTDTHCESADANAKSFLTMIKEIENTLPVGQEELKAALLDHILSEGKLYKKTEPVRARLARVGEVVITITQDGEEGHNIAKAGDLVVQNQTEAKEKYIVTSEKFKSRYEIHDEPSEQWLEYQASGEAHAIEITHDVTTQLNVGSNFFIIAAWNETQFASEGDYFVSPSPNFDEIYRIGKPEFKRTYAMKE